MARNWHQILVKKIKIMIARLGSGFSKTVKTWPLVSFLGLIGLLVCLIALSNWIGKPAEETELKEAAVKQVETYGFGSVPTMTVQGQVEKSGVIQITAQTPGIVSWISVKEGQSVKKGAQLISLSTNYQGGNAMALQSQMAQKQLENVVTTYPIQKNLVLRQKEAAEKTDTNADELRTISSNSLSETRDLLSLNESIVSTLGFNLKSYESTNSAGANDALILQTQQLKSQFQSVVNQLKSAIRATEYQVDTSKTPTALVDLQREITIRQLFVQDKAIDLSLEVSRLQYKLAQVNAGLMYPAAPFAGTIQRIHVRAGQAVNPGTVLVTLVGNKQELTVAALVPREIARSVSKLEASKLQLGNKTVELSPTHISTEATAGNLYTLLFDIPAEYVTGLTDKSYVQIELPIGYAETTAKFPFVPLDAIYQTQDQAYVFVVRDGKAESKTVSLGEILGSQVQITEGLDGKEEVILTRNVVAGDRVEVIKI